MCIQGMATPIYLVGNTSDLCANHREPWDPPWFSYAEGHGRLRTCVGICPEGHPCLFVSRGLCVYLFIPADNIVHIIRISLKFCSWVQLVLLVVSNILVCY